MNTYYVTFGYQSALHDYFIEVHATSKDEALSKAEKLYLHLSMVYDGSEWDSSFFPKGQLDIIN